MQYKHITFDLVKNDPTVKTYIKHADSALHEIGYTEHGFAHVMKTAETVTYILSTLGYPEEEIELAQIASYLHDIGNVVNRNYHSQSGAIMAFRILDRMNMDPDKICRIISAIGNHDEGTAHIGDIITAALIIADKSDVRRTRVRGNDITNFDIHHRVNYSVERAEVQIDETKSLIKLSLTIDTNVCSILDYFEIFMTRMLLCKKAAKKLNLEFRLVINDQQVL